MSRKGRKRNPAAKRHQTTRAGQGRTAKEPVPEMAMERKLELVGDKSKLDMADTPLHILAARGIISRQLADAGMTFAVLRWSLFGRPFTGETTLAKVQSGGGRSLVDEVAAMESEIIRRDKYERADAALRTTGSRARTQVVNVAVAQRLPPWLARQGRSMVIRSGDETDALALKAGLEAIADELGVAYEKAA